MRRLVRSIPLRQDLFVVEGSTRGHVGLVGIAVQADEGIGPRVDPIFAVRQADGEAVAHLGDWLVGHHLDGGIAALVEGLPDLVLDTPHGDAGLDEVGRGLRGSPELGDLEGHQHSEKGQDQDGQTFAHESTSGLETVINGRIEHEKSSIFLYHII